MSRRSSIPAGEIENWTAGARSQLRRRLLAWFRREARDLPWRKSRDPYRVWISEIMLQQTQVAAVIPYFERFVAEFPDVQSLAAAPEQRVLRLWEGLGYYRRARQLHAAAKQIVEQHGGQFPREIEQARALPGIGRYTAGAILSIAYDCRLPILEANTVRLYCRLLAEAGDPQSSTTQQRLWQFAEQILPRRDVGLFNQALMEVGSLVCKPRDPDCAHCPLATLCPTQREGRQATIPAPKRRPPREDVVEAVIVIRRGNEILLRQRGAEERWAGMWDFPRFPLEALAQHHVEQELADKTAAQIGVKIVPGTRWMTITHGVTRFNITLHCYHAEPISDSCVALENVRWFPLEDLADVPLSVTARKISRALS